MENPEPQAAAGAAEKIKQFCATHKKTVIISLVIALVLVAAMPAYQYFVRDSSLLQQAQAGIVIVPEKESVLGVDPMSAFFVKSQDGLSAEAVQANLSVLPASDFAVKQKNGNEVKIEFAKPLKGNKVYVFRLNIDGKKAGAVQAAESANNSLAGGDERNILSWAFQTAEVFQVNSTLPGDRSTGVPTNSGIEMNFSHEGFEDVASFFEISPQVNGRFEIHKKTAVFVPEKLEPAKVYTVKIKKGIAVKGAEKLALAEDYVFSFETKEDEGGDGKISLNIFKENFESNIFEFGVAERPAFNAGVYDSVWRQNEAEKKDKLDVRIFKFSGEKEFLAAVQDCDDGAVDYAWSLFSKNKIQDTAALAPVASFAAQLESGTGIQYFSFPESLPAGFYLVDAEVTDTPEARDQVYVQITDLAAYFVASDTESLLWLNDAGKKNPLAGGEAEIISCAGKKKIAGETDKDGLLAFNTRENFSDESEAKYLKIADREGRLVFIAADSARVDSSPNADKFWSYLYVDRTKYQTTDKVAFWGLARKRNAEKAEKVPLRAEIGYGGEEIFSQDLETNEWGTFSGEVEIKNWEVGGYNLNILEKNNNENEEDDSVAGTYFEVATYIKPAYNIALTAEKNAVFAKTEEGQPQLIKAFGKVSFFDGTPAPEVELEWDEEKLQTDEKGEFKLESEWENDAGERGEIEEEYLSVSPVGFEDGSIEGSASVDVFPARVGVKVETAKGGAGKQIIVKTFKVCLEKLNDADADNDEYECGAAAGQKINLKVSERYFEKKEAGEHYDFVEKKKIKEYEYEERFNFVGEEELAADSDGKITSSLVLENGKDYRIEVSVTDDHGEKWREEKWEYGYANIDDFKNNYSLEYEEKEGAGAKEYRSGEKIKLAFKKSQADAPSGGENRYLFYQAKAGIFARTINDNAKYEFETNEKNIPNTEVTATWWNGRTYVKRSLNLDYDQMEKNLNITLSPDKAAYLPREKVNLAVLVQDENKNGKSAAVNLSVVDEAMGNEGISAAEINTGWRGVYRQISSGISFSYASHQYPLLKMLGEMGGCFASGTPILLADGTTKDIAAIKIGDQILTRKNPESPQMVAGKVSEVFEHTVGGYLIINGHLRVTPEHIVFASGKFMPAGELEKKDLFLTADNKWEEVNSIEVWRGAAKVYNFTVEKYHTYFADNVYVHNCKGGDCAGRYDFPDRAFFGEIRTDANGQGAVSFKVPDTVTSWRVTTQGVSDDLFAGGHGDFNVAVSLPFFTDAVLGSEYLVGDKPIFKVRAFGKELPGEETVNFTVDMPTLGSKGVKTSAKAFASAEIPFPELKEGDHNIIVTAEAGKLKDTITKTISVYRSKVSKKTADYQPLKVETQLKSAANSITTLMVSDEGRGKLLNLLLGLANNQSARGDGLLTKIEARDLLRKYFGEEYAADNTEEMLAVNNYKKDGGLALLPYGDADLLTTVFAAAVGKEKYFTGLDMQDYFETVLKDKTETRERFILALTGMAALGEPVLLDLEKILKEKDLSAREKLFLALAESFIGNRERAKEIVREVSTKYAEKSSNNVWKIKGGNAEDILIDTLLAAEAAAAANMDEHAAFFNYVAVNQEKNLPLFLDRIVYAQRALAIISEQAGEFSYALNSETRTEKISAGGTFRRLLSPEEAKSIKFTDIKGSLGVTTFFAEAVSEKQNENTAPIRVSRSYRVKDKTTNEFRESDIVKVELAYEFSPQAGDGCYQITDSLPAGLKFFDGYSPVDDNELQYPHAINGQQVKFCAHRNDKVKKIAYLARVAGKGEFLAEGTLAQSADRPSEWSQFAPGWVQIK